MHPSTESESTRRVPAGDTAWPVRPVIALAVAVCVLHMVLNVVTPYGYHRDELLYMAMGQHLKVWRMDFPPLIAMISVAERALLGSSLVAIRAMPALAVAALIVTTGAIARTLGGGRTAQLLAAAAVALSPLFLRTADLFQPVVLDQLWWSLAILVLARLCSAAPDARGLADDWSTWIVLGVVAGVGLLTKFSIVFLGVAMAIGLLLCRERRALLTGGPWIAALVALVVGSPSIVGQLRLGIPVAAQMHALEQSQLSHVSRLSFVTEQLLWGPAVLLAALGLVYLMLAAKARRFRLIGWTCAAAWMLLWLLHGKSYYIGSIYPALFAAGGVAAECWRPGERRRQVITTWLALTVVYALATFPLTLPVLAPERTAEFAQAIGITAATRTNHGIQLQLPQDYADLLGWPEQVAAVARVYDSLPPAQRARAVIFAENYGEAAAVDFFGPRLGLPHAVSAAGSYWFFGPGEEPGGTILTIGVSRADLDARCGKVASAGRVRSEWSPPEDADVSLFICEAPRQTLQQLWPSLAGRN
jgi:hypothetical protein